MRISQGNQLIGNKSAIGKRWTWGFFFGLGVLLWGATTCTVPGGQAWADSKESCRQEVHQLCSTAEEGPSRQACVKQNLDKFSPACQEKIRNRWAKHQQKASPEEEPAQK